MKLIFIILTLLITSLAFGDTDKYKELRLKQCDDEIKHVGGPCLDGASRSYKGNLPEQHRNINGFLLSGNSFKEAEQIFGEAPIWHSGDAAASEYKVCYISELKKQKIVLVVASNSEMTGGKMVDELRLIQGNVDFLNQCGTTLIKPENLRTKSGIYLGMPIKEFKKIMGEASGINDGLLFYVYCERKPYKLGDTWCVENGKSIAERCSGISARFINGMLQWLTIGFGDYVC